MEGEYYGGLAVHVIESIQERVCNGYGRVWSSSFIDFGASMNPYVRGLLV